MKLVHQINLAFGLLLVVILGATAVMIHYVLLDHLIVAQKNEMKTLGASVATTLRTQAAPLGIAGAIEDIPTLEASPVQLTAGVQAIVADENGNVLSRTLPLQPVLTAGGTVIPVPEGQEETLSFSPENLQALQSGQDGRYIVEVSAVPQGTLTLVTPMSKVSELEQALFGRLLVVLGVGGILVLLLSLVITRKLIRPLMKLREELKKVKERRFADVRKIPAGGEIGAVAQTVYELAGELDRYVRVQKLFVQNASHELKTPLMSIAGYAEGIRDGVFEGADVRKGLDVILGESGRLKKIVSEMTLLAKLDSEEDVFRPAPVPLKELLDDTVERINPMLVARELSLQVAYEEATPERLTVRADRDKLLQALLNVVANAARHARRSIELRVGTDQDQVVIAISDDGGGIPEELLPHLFHRFVKGKDGENGLGLAISRAIVERCGGRIEAGNRDEGGAVFSFRLPSPTPSG
ncbi:sensor histidine kinase [Cohnella cellulosilytica]|uniref:histidine kinase n=1 Tax=Cohnella cellulosilytica TaxID=986710 RepID=A0ABW2F338_9BACL